MTDRNPHARLIEELRAAATTSRDSVRRERLLAILSKLEQSHGTASFGGHVKALIAEAEADAAEIAPFLSRLSSLLP
jgi:hypothetical protein